jgi:hypothetical protein
MFIRSFCFVVLVVVPMALPAQPADGEGKVPKNETLMLPGMRIQLLAQLNNTPEKDKDKRYASADCLLSPKDYETFRPGRSKDDILKDVQWRGNFEMATEYKGKIVSAISFGLFGGPFSSDGGDSVWAIFADDKFQKFVRWPVWGDEPIKVGDFRRLIRAVESEPVSLSDLEQEAKARPAPPRQTDFGLTLAWLALRPAIEAARKNAVKRNAELRDQFNASRLCIGMTEAEVQSVLRAKPIETGDVEAGAFKFYGSTESLDVLPYLHYSNILVLFREGKVRGIYSGCLVPGGEQGLQQLRKSFVDLPHVKTSAQSTTKPADTFKLPRPSVPN